jgi:hypothetical protein
LKWKKFFEINGGGGRIRTCEGRSPGDLQSPAFGRLATPPTEVVLPRVCGFRRYGQTLLRVGAPPFKWSGRRDSNPRPAAWKAAALPTELRPLPGSGGGTRTRDQGINSPPLCRLSYPGSQSLQNMVGPAGFEPATQGLEIPCSIQLSYGPYQGAYNPPPYRGGRA